MGFRSSRAPRTMLAASLLLGAAACARRTPEPSRSVPAPSAAQALRVYRDPSTGAFVEPPPGAAPIAAPGPPAAAPGALTEEAAPGGGRMIRLHGAFRSQLVGHADARSTTVSCASAAAARPAPASP